MCGIIGIIGKYEASPRLLIGLHRLSYRGYDSAGIATILDNQIKRQRAQGKLSNLETLLDRDPLPGTIGIGHTRWATHGYPNEINAHPHVTPHVGLVHNGIIENYRELKFDLEKYQRRFETDTDTEVVVHLLSYYIEQGNDVVTASELTFQRLQGAFALAVIFANDPNTLIGVRQGAPLLIGYGDGEMYLASDAFALAHLTNDICYLEDGDRVLIHRDGAQISNRQGDVVHRDVKRISISNVMIGKNGYRHFMLKEIYEQPRTINETLNSFLPLFSSISDVPLPGFCFDIGQRLHLTVIGCGTSYYAGCIAKYWFERIARVSVDVDIASEFRYRDTPMSCPGVTIVISQSGETFDTLEVLRYAKNQGQHIISIINVPESSIARESDTVLQTLAGPEICVASTKALTTQLTILFCIAITLAVKRGVISKERAAALTGALRKLPSSVMSFLQHAESIEEVAKHLVHVRDVLYLGRGFLFPIALEGALKLKEITYIHAEGYAAGELKHGPLALVDESVPVIVLASSGDLLDKMISNVREVSARRGRVIVIGDQEAIERMREHIWHSITLPQVSDPLVVPILYTIPVQLLAYHTAILKGTDVDQPRNLAKSVTVE